MSILNEEIDMHINDIYALRGELSKILANEVVDRSTVRALLSAVCDEITEFEDRLEQRALAEEAYGEMYMAQYD